MAWYSSHILTIITFLPLLGAVFIAFLGRERTSFIRWVALLFSLLTFLITVCLYFQFEPRRGGMQFEEMKQWMILPPVNYHLGVDGLSALMVLLTGFLTPLSVLVSWKGITQRVKEFFIFLLALETGMMGVFASLDLVLFFLFWEVMLIPMYFLIGIWGHERRVYAAIKFVLYTMVGSALMLTGIIYLYNITGTFDLPRVLNHLVRFSALSPQAERWLFLAFFIAFAIKVPIFPFHTWLPDAHVEAPTAGSVILAGVLLKMGTYGMLRFCLPLFPDASREFAPIICVLAIVGIIYGALVAMVQPDLKKLVAYSSVAHLGFCVLGIFVFRPEAMEGAIYQMFSHGVSTGALFMLVGMLYERRHTRLISDFGGLATSVPVYSTFFLIVALSSLGLPLLNGFVGEFLIIIGSFYSHAAYAALASAGVVLAAVYLLWMYQRVFYGEITNDKNRTLPDCDLREKLILAIMVVVIIAMGIYPQPFLRRMDRGVTAIMFRLDRRSMIATERAAPSGFAIAGVKNRQLGIGNRELPVEAIYPVPHSLLPCPQPLTAYCPLLTAYWFTGGWPMMTLQPVDMMRILPEIILSVFAVLVMVLEPFVSAASKKLLGWMALLGVLAAGGSVTHLSLYPWPGMGSAFGGAVTADEFGFYFIYLFLLVAGLVILGSMNYLERDHAQHGEFYALVLMGTVGMCFMAASTDLIMIFLGLEISSIATYILAGYRRTDRLSNEASLKYFLLGSFATAFLLYGIAFIYGLTGTTNLLRASARLGTASQWTPFAQVAMILIFVGLAFKLSTAPFQIWAPDVYQGAPAPVTAFLSVGPKAAAFAVLLRVFLGSFSSASTTGFWILWISAALTMCVGNLAALWQSNVKRLLAYSSIAHAGYVLVGVTAGGSRGISAVLYYLVAYALMNVGAFILIAHLAGKGERLVEIDDYKGLAFERPAVAACLTVFFLSLAGFPTTAGFLGKFYLFRAAIHSNLIGLTILALLTSTVSVYYYFKIIVAMYMHEGKTETAEVVLPWPVRAALAVSILGIFWLGLAPNGFVGLSTLATMPLLK